MVDSDQMPLDEGRPRRRMTAHEIADSTAVKLLQPIVLSLLVPAVTWGGNKVLDRMDKIEAAISASAATSATNELRLRVIEATEVRRGEEIQKLSDRINQLVVRVELIDARTQRK